jgi:hypothetical protein
MHISPSPQQQPSQGIEQHAWSIQLCPGSQQTLPHSVWFGMQSVATQWPVLSQVCDAGQVPQFNSPPQPSPTCPQTQPMSLHAFGQHSAPPHTFGTPPPPQVCPQ